MPLTYLEKKYHIGFILTLLGLSLLGLWAIAALGFVLYGLLLTLYRKDHKDYLESHQASQGVVLSPVNGRVRSIRSGVDHELFGANCIEIVISIPWWKEWGLRLPVTGEVADLQHKLEKSFFRFSKIETANDSIRDSGTLYSIFDSNGNKLGLQFLRCPLGLSPQTILLPGDRGMRGANFGYFPLGGSVLIYLGQNYEIMVNIDDQVVSGETPLAGDKS